MTDVSVCNRKINSQTINVCNWPVRRKYLMEAPELLKRTPARKPCVTDVLCNWDINSRILKRGVCVCNTFGPHSTFLLSTFGAFLAGLRRGEGLPLVRYLCKLHGRHV